MHSALNGNIVCRQILLVKLRCKKSFFAENYRYLSWKYNISDCDWYTNITCLIGNVKIKQKLLYPLSHDASILHDLCSMRDDDFFKMFTETCIHFKSHCATRNIYINLFSIKKL